MFCHGPFQACVEEYIPFVCNTRRLPLDMALVFALAVFVVGSGVQKLVAFDATASRILQVLFLMQGSCGGCESFRWFLPCCRLVSQLLDARNYNALERQR